jgi:hypothetical protein
MDGVLRVSVCPFDGLSPVIFTAYSFVTSTINYLTSLTLSFHVSPCKAVFIPLSSSISVTCDFVLKHQRHPAMQQGGTAATL